jgi:hypothetical protein
MLFNTKTKQRVSEYDLYSQFPDTSFPSPLTDNDLIDTDLVVLRYGPHPTCLPSETVQDVGQSLIDGAWTVTYAVVPKSVDQLRADIFAEIEQLEASVTERRKREAILGLDDGWLHNLNVQISNLRDQLS